MRYYYSKKSNRILAFHPAGGIEVFEVIDEAESVVDAPPIEPSTKKLPVLINGPTVRHCKACGKPGHRKDSCNTTRDQLQRKGPAIGNGFNKAKRAGKPPIDEHAFGLIREKKEDADNTYTATEIAEIYDIDRDVVVDAIIAPNWQAYSERYTG